MELTLKNYQPKRFLKLLAVFNGQRRQARALARFVRLLQRKELEIEEERLTIFKAYCELDDQGELRLTEDQQVIWKEGQKNTGINEVSQLFEDESILDLTEFANYFDDLVSLLENEEVSLDSQQAQVYDQLLEVLETNVTQ